MTLQPTPGYNSGDAARPTPSPQPAPVPPQAPEASARPSDVPDAQLGNPDGAWLRVISAEPSPVHLSDSQQGERVETGEIEAEAPSTGPAQSLGGSWGGSEPSPASSNAVTAPRDNSGRESVDVVPARRRPSRPPQGISVVGGRTVKLHRVVALDRLASGIGYLTVEWRVRQRGFDLLALQDGSTVAARANTLTIDLTQPMNRVLIATGTQGTMPVPASELRVSNGSTQVIIPIDGGTSLGVWPRLTLTRVDEFVVIRHEHDPLSGILSAVAGAYGYDERNFVLAHSHVLR